MIMETDDQSLTPIVQKSIIFLVLSYQYMGTWLIELAEQNKKEEGGLFLASFLSKKKSPAIFQYTTAIARFSSPFTSISVKSIRTRTKQPQLTKVLSPNFPTLQSPSISIISAQQPNTLTFFSFFPGCLKILVLD